MSDHLAPIVDFGRDLLIHDGAPARPPKPRHFARWRDALAAYEAVKFDSEALDHLLLQYTDAAIPFMTAIQEISDTIQRDIIDPARGALNSVPCTDATLASFRTQENRDILGEGLVCGIHEGGRRAGVWHRRLLPSSPPSRGRIRTRGRK